MVPVALLCDLAFGAEQAPRRNPGIWLHSPDVPRTLARYLAGAQRAVSASLQMGILAAGHRRHRTRLGGRQPAGGLGRDSRAARHSLLFRSLPGSVSADWQA